MLKFPFSSSRVSIHHLSAICLGNACPEAGSWWRGRIWPGSPGLVAVSKGEPSPLNQPPTPGLITFTRSSLNSISIELCLGRRRPLLCAHIRLSFSPLSSPDKWSQKGRSHSQNQGQSKSAWNYRGICLYVTSPNKCQCWDFVQLGFSAFSYQL